MPLTHGLSLLSSNPNCRKKKKITNLQPYCRDKRIFSTGCAGDIDQSCSVAMPKSINYWWTLTIVNQITEENMKMTDCYFEKKDWRQCKDEASCHHNVLTQKRPFANLILHCTASDGDFQTLLESSWQRPEDLDTGCRQQCKITRHGPVYQTKTISSHSLKSDQLINIRTCRQSPRPECPAK